MGGGSLEGRYDTLRSSHMSKTDMAETGSGTTNHRTQWSVRSIALSVMRFEVRI